MISISPCMDCSFRQSGCHATCPIYGAWKAVRDQEKKERLARQETECLINDLTIRNMDKVAKAKRRLRSAKKK